MKASDPLNTILSEPNRTQRPPPGSNKVNLPLSDPGMKNRIAGKGSSSASRLSAVEKATERTKKDIEKRTAQDRKGKTPARDPKPNDPSPVSRKLAYAQSQAQGHLWVAVHTQYHIGGDDDPRQNMTLFLDCGGNDTLITEIVCDTPEATDWELREIRGRRRTDFPALVAMVYVAYIPRVDFYRQYVQQTPTYRNQPVSDTMYHWVVAVLRRLRAHGISMRQLRMIVLPLQYAF